MQPSETELARLHSLLSMEQEAKEQGYKVVAGVDEAGRGPLAGPVVACACVMLKPVLFPGVNDSKQLSVKKRDELFSKITSHPQIFYAVAFVSESLIDEINIYQATVKAMQEALQKLPVQVDKALIDGLALKDFPILTEKVIKGDSRCYSIALASIIAKCTRDKLMEEFDRQYPEYGFARHKGYGTKKHMEALKKFGPSPIHRKSFAPIKTSF